MANICHVNWFWIVAIGCVLSSDPTSAVEVKCASGNPKTCSVPTPIILTDDTTDLTFSTTEDAATIDFFSLDSDENSHVPTFPKQLFQTFVNVKEVRFWDSQMVSLNQDSFEGASHLLGLNLNRNNLTRLPKDVFQHAPQLVNLYLADNQIENIEDGAFNGLSKLVEIRLDNNRLTIIRKGTFAELTNLAVLSLDENQLTTIESGALVMPNLSYGYFSKNQLTTLPDTLCDGIPKSFELDFTGNRLRHIGNAFDKCQRLTKLILNDNSIEDLNLAKLATLKSLEKLFLIKSGLRLPETPRPMDMNHGNGKLENLYLQNNQLNDTKLFEHLAVFTKLKRVCLDDNSLMDLGDPKRIKEMIPSLFSVFFPGNDLSKWKAQYKPHGLSLSGYGGIYMYDLKCSI